jgi:hypothetical protein
VLTKTDLIRAKSQSFGKALALGGGIASIIAAVTSVAFGATSVQGTVSIVLLLMLAISLAGALGLQALTFGRARRYAVCLPEIMQLAENIWCADPSVMTGKQATEMCDTVVEGLARIFQQISGARCHVSIELVAPLHEGLRGPLRRSSDYVVVNLSRDPSIDTLEHENRRQHPVDSNSSYRALFRAPGCQAYFFREDAAADMAYASSEYGAEELMALRRQRGRWPLHYRSTLMVKICHAERCAEQGDHKAIGFLWLRSPEVGAFDEQYDVELMQRMGRAVAPLVTRCVKATMPTYDFRRQQAAAP